MPEIGADFRVSSIAGGEASCDRRLVDRAECQMMDTVLDGGEVAVR